jgi:L-asparaginase/Glu-tRNA(Gln) amidotransferase subunit D/CheY-like chemotaxis protein
MQTINLILIDDECTKFDSLLKAWFNRFAELTQNELKFEIHSCDNLDSGMKLLKTISDPDLIILDLYFGQLTECSNSYQIIRHAKEYLPNCPVVILSATKRIKDIQEISNVDEYKADLFLSKEDTLNHGKTAGELDPDFKALYSHIHELLLKYGRIQVKNGILITHGTDTMSWAFAILRYGLFDVKTNIVLTGSQLPLEGTFSPSDAIGNVLTSVKLLNMLEPPNIIQVFNDGVHIFNKNLNKVKKWSLDAFTGETFAVIETETLKIFENGVNRITRENKLRQLHFIKTGGTIDSEKSETGLTATADFTTQYIESLEGKYFDEYLKYEINPKDSSLFTPFDWSLMLEKISETNLSEADIRFDWNILVTIINPFLKHGFYKDLLEMLINDYSGMVILGFGAGNANIFSSNKVNETKEYKENYCAKFGEQATRSQMDYSIIPFLEGLESYNTSNPEDYRFLIMSSQVPYDSYDNEYQSGIIPLHYGALPSGDLSFPEAQTKLAYILGHKDMIIRKAKEANLTFEQVVKSSLLCGVTFIRKANKREFLRISDQICNCKIAIHPKNVFVKLSFEKAIDLVIQLLK